MNWEQYRQDANRTRKGDHLKQDELLNAVLGLCGEAGEVAESVENSLREGTYKRGNLKLELGDVLFYLDWAAAVSGLSMAKVDDASIETVRWHNNDLQSASLALCSRACRIAEIVKKALFHGNVFGPDVLKLEFARVLSCIDWVTYITGLSMQEIADANIDKLKRRYPNGFETGGGVR